MKRTLLAVFGLVAICGAAAAGHHSIAGAYDSSRQVTVEGTVAQFQFVHPHPMVTLDVAGTDGAVRSWRLEMDSRGELSAIGIAEDTFKRGDRLIVRGSMSRTQPNSMYIQRLDRPSDGFGLEQVGGTPKIRRRPQAGAPDAGSYSHHHPIAHIARAGGAGLTRVSPVPTPTPVR
jgi:hypothetical protein